MGLCCWFCLLDLGFVVVVGGGGGGGGVDGGGVDGGDGCAEREAESQR